jgi:uncharacterized membrane protein YhaH (DUF805 family)
MTRLSPKVHGVLDYLTVLFLALSPYLFSMSSAAAVFTYMLAAVHLLLTLFTNFAAGVVRVVPLRVHGAIEFCVSFLLIVVANWFRTHNDLFSFYYYLVFAVVLFIVWLLSSYRTYSSFLQK